MSDEAELRALAARLGADPYPFDPVTIRKGVVASIQGTTPPTVTVYLSGDTTEIPGIRFMRSYRPVVADTVLLLQQGKQYTVLDVISDAHPVGQVFASLMATVLNTPLVQYVGTETVNLHLGEDGAVLKGATARGVIMDRASGYLFRGSGTTSSATAKEDWTNLSLTGGWSSIDTVQYKLFPDGVLRMRGIADAGGAIVDGTAVGTLPAGYRPSMNALIPLVFDASVTHGRALVRTNGRVEVYEAPNQYPSLSCVEFGL